MEETNKPVDDTNWRKVYLLVIGFFALFCLFMYLFTSFSA